MLSLSLAPFHSTASIPVCGICCTLFCNSAVAVACMALSMSAKSISAGTSINSDSFSQWGLASCPSLQIPIQRPPQLQQWTGRTGLLLHPAQCLAVHFQCAPEWSHSYVSLVMVVLLCQHEFNKAGVDNAAASQSLHGPCLHWCKG